MKNLIIGIIIYTSFAFSQQVEISVENLKVVQAVLSSLSGETVSPLDTITSSGNGKFLFSLDSGKHRTGFYRLSFDTRRWVDFVNDNEDIIIKTDTKNILDSIKILSSESNRLLYVFRKLNDQYKVKSEILQLVLSRYPPDDPYYQATRDRAVELQSSYLSFIKSTTATHPTSFIERYIRSAQLSFGDITLSLNRQLIYLKSHALDNVDFSDVNLIYSDLFTTKVIDYLTYYRNPQFPKELLAKEFNKAADTILTKARVNPEVYKHITQYLLDGFKEFGFEECMRYLLDNYVLKDDLCLDNASGNTVQRMIDQRKKLPVGGTTPDILLPDSAGTLVSLTSMKTDKTLIVFYTSTCLHCLNMLPMLQEVMKTEKGEFVSVFTVSLDTNRTEWLNFIRSYSKNWTNVIDIDGWNGDAARDFYLYATPTMILIDKSRSILAKPLTLNELLTLL